jgi:hypothetical protein
VRAFYLPVLVTQLFAPTSFVITYDGPDDVESVLERDAAGQVVRINLPQKLVIVANHQVRTRSASLADGPSGTRRTYASVIFFLSGVRRLAVSLVLDLLYEVP